MRFHIQEFHTQFRTNVQCLQYLFEKRFPETECPKCGRRNAYHRHPTKPCYTCTCGQSHIYPKKGTIFENSAIPLSKCFYAMFLMSQSEQGVSAKELERRIKVTYPTAWKLAKRIRAILPDETVLSSERTFESVLQCCFLIGSDVTTSKPSRQYNRHLHSHRARHSHYPCYHRTLPYRQRTNDRNISSSHKLP